MSIIRLRRLRDMLPHGLFGRTVLIILLPVLLLQGAATYIFFDRHWSRMTQRLAYAVAGEAAYMAATLEANPSEADVFALKRNMASSLEMLVTFEPDAQREGLESIVPDGADLEATLANAMETQVRRPFDVSVDRDRKRVQATIQLSNGVLEISMPQNRLYDSSAFIFIYWLNGLALLFFLISITFMRNQIRPIRRLAVAAERFGKGIDVARFKPSGAREVRQAAAAFFSMKERISRQLMQRTAMLAGVSHDLRTPLTRMKLQLEMMGPSPDHDALKQDLQDMERMIEVYLAFIRGEGDEAASMTDMVALLERVAANAVRAGLDLTLRLPARCELEVRPQAIERALQNILGNARKYADKAKLEASMDAHAGLFIITVDDNGPGIDPKHYDDVFKPFVRLDPSRNTKTGGVGLGLSITQDIVLGHGGRIFLGTSPMGGLRVTIQLPL